MTIIDYAMPMNCSQAPSSIKAHLCHHRPVRLRRSPVLRKEDTRIRPDAVIMGAIYAVIDLDREPIATRSQPAMRWPLQVRGQQTGVPGGKLVPNGIRRWFVFKSPVRVACSTIGKVVSAARRSAPHALRVRDRLRSLSGRQTEASHGSHDH